MLTGPRNTGRWTPGPAGQAEAGEAVSAGHGAAARGRACVVAVAGVRRGHRLQRQQMLVLRM